MKDAVQDTYEFNSKLPFETIIWEDVTLEVNIESMKKWLKNPMKYNKKIRELSNELYDINGIYTNVVDYTISIPTLDRVVYSTDKKSKNYNKNKSSFLKALRIMKDKTTTRDLLFKAALEGVAFSYFEVAENYSFDDEFLSDGEIDNITEINQEFNCGVISLPTNYCKIVGTKNSAYVIAFDMSYFEQFKSNGLSKKLMSYPKEIRDKYKIYRSPLIELQ